MVFKNICILVLRTKASVLEGLTLSCTDNVYWKSQIKAYSNTWVGFNIPLRKKQYGTGISTNETIPYIYTHTQKENFVTEGNEKIVRPF